jgi:small-conductance mechanosensitive channel
MPWYVDLWLAIRVWNWSSFSPILRFFHVSNILKMSRAQSFTGVTIFSNLQRRLTTNNMSRCVIYQRFFIVFVGSMSVANVVCCWNEGVWITSHVTLKMQLCQNLTFACFLVLNTISWFYRSTAFLRLINTTTYKCFFASLLSVIACTTLGNMCLAKQSAPF